jgi:hypothetical protein
MKKVFLALIALATTGCAPQYSDFFPYHDDGTPKPSVAVLPYFNDTHTKFSWDLAKELTDSTYEELKKHGTLFLPSQATLHKQMAETTKSELLSTHDLMPFLYFQPEHFVVVLDLVEHKFVPYQRGRIKPLYPAHVHPDDAVVLVMKVRLRVVDIRGGEPKLVLQEVVDSNHVIAKQDLAESMLLHGKDKYLRSALGMAHARLVRDIVEKIERITSFQR